MRNTIWKRLDQEGHDACRFVRERGGWLVEGHAVFKQGSGAASLSYQVFCDDKWRSVRAAVSGWIARQEIEVTIERSADGNWRTSAEVAAALDALQDIDLGFTPATNTLAIRRMNLTVGDQAETTTVWLDTEDWRFKRLPQRYRRVAEDAYEYHSPIHDFQAIIRVDQFGVVMDYPGLWVAVS